MLKHTTWDVVKLISSLVLLVGQSTRLSLWR